MPSPAADETLAPITIPAGAHGTLRGVEIRDGTGRAKARRFLQVPFAQPPTGDLRWRKPLPLPEDHSWSQVAGESFGNLMSQPIYEITTASGETVSLVSVPGSAYSEDALTANIWTPPGQPPSGGWPVLVFFHGGWLQIGSPNMTDKNNATELVDEALRCVVVAPAYRLSVFGFLAGKEIRAENEDGTAGNFGFWDQRLALEWVAQNAQLFGGNGANITIAGLSAGSYSVEVQLAHELVSGAKPIISRAMMSSNAVPSQPKTVEQSQAAFDGLLEACGIPLDLSGADKMERLRAVPAEELQGKIMKLKIHTFRAVTDNAFISNSMYAAIQDGSFARAFNDRGMSLIIGEVPEEELLYAATNAPKSRDDLRTQLCNYYRDDQVDRLLAAFSVPEDADARTLQTTFGDIVAHGQVYVPTRSLVRSLLAAGVPPERVLRYRVAWRAAAAAAVAPFPTRLTHADCQPLWWYLRRQGAGWTPTEVEVARRWLAPVQRFMDGDVAGAAREWYTGAAPRDGAKLREVRDATIAVVPDERWERCAQLAEEIAVQ